MIKVKVHGNFEKTNKYLEKLKNLDTRSRLEYYGELGVEALKEATPVRTGKTAASWYYEVKKTSKGYTLSWKNSNIIQNVNIALIIQFGHGTRYGAYVEGRDYINPALNKVMEYIKEDLRKGLIK